MNRRARKRLWRHHAPLALGTVVASLALVALLPGETARRWSIATAHVSLVLLATTLVLGPLNVLRHRANPLSADLRRDLGIWAAITGLFHVVVGLQVHMGGHPLQYFLVPSATFGIRPRVDAFGVTNYLGLAATLILALLLTLSNDAALRNLGPSRWKALQRWSYALGVLVALHAALFQGMEKRTLPLVALFVLVAAATVTLQIRGWRARRARQSRPLPTGIAQAER